MIAYDVWYRRNGIEKAMYHPAKGGHFFFMPSWIVGMIVALGGGALILASYVA